MGTVEQDDAQPLGASKTAADVMAQEYGRYFGMNVGVFRGGCLTGEHHSYLVKLAKAGETYTIFGYKGEQVRDQIRSADVIGAFVEFARHPRPGEVYNLGGGRENSASILECVARIEELVGRKLNWVYENTARVGDHICYISDLAKFRSHYPSWRLTTSLDEILRKMVSTVGGNSR